MCPATLLSQPVYGRATTRPLPLSQPTNTENEMSDKKESTQKMLFPVDPNVEITPTDDLHHVTVLRIRNSKTERRQIEKIMNEHDFEEHELHLFIWYMGYRLVLDNFLGRSTSAPPTDDAVYQFIARHAPIH